MAFVGMGWWSPVAHDRRISKVIAIGTRTPYAYNLAKTPQRRVGDSWLSRLELAAADVPNACIETEWEANYNNHTISFNKVLYDLTEARSWVHPDDQRARMEWVRARVIGSRLVFRHLRADGGYRVVVHVITSVAPGIIRGRGYLAPPVIAQIHPPPIRSQKTGR